MDYTSQPYHTLPTRTTIMDCGVEDGDQLGMVVVLPLTPSQIHDLRRRCPHCNLVRTVGCCEVTAANLPPLPELFKESGAMIPNHMKEWGYKRAQIVWRAEDHMGHVYEMAADCGERDEMVGLTPFDYHGADFFVSLMNDEASGLAMNTEELDAFVVGAQRIILANHGRQASAMPCLAYTILIARHLNDIYHNKVDAEIDDYDWKIPEEDYKVVEEYQVKLDDHFHPGMREAREAERAEEGS
jgi:hypothetical protein